MRATFPAQLLATYSPENKRPACPAAQHVLGVEGNLAHHGKLLSWWGGGGHSLREPLLSLDPPPTSTFLWTPTLHAQSGAATSSLCVFGK